MTRILAAGQVACEVLMPSMEVTIVSQRVTVTGRLTR